MIERPNIDLSAIEDARKKIAITLSVPASYFIVSEDERRRDEIEPIKATNGNQ